jgi:uncharacterized membrane protein YedE/YeeE
MIRLVSFVIIGAIFGLGIGISGMANPSKVLNFFDLFGTWDPSLIFVMGGALVTTAIGYRIVFARQKMPKMGSAFALPANNAIDFRLIAGSATFGVGWGIAGFCPGGAIPALGLGYAETLLFVTAMAIGIIIARQADKYFRASTVTS